MNALECARLAAELREVKERAGLSLAALARHTPYSKSSWDRYLNGKQQPPKQAVESLCEVAQEPPGRLLALWGLADPAWSGRARSTPADVPAPRPSAAAVRRARRGRRTALVGGGAAAAVAAVTLAVVLSTGVGPGGTGGSGRDAAGVKSSAPAAQFEPGCRARSCEGKDPKKMGCGRQGMAVSPLVRTAPGGQRVEIRHSERCGAVWARGMNLRVGDRIELSQPGARTKRALARSAEDYVATPMTPARDAGRAEVCLDPAAGGGDGRVCFGDEKKATAQ
ncbi:hypothetical protein STRAU_4540 [Streptomyces aurantiacus JA 4570]|uniref:HTH cro/C1-type domain-containing protein n=1 Tax=Streptomyces aurantiacus JA 4570 TaxID=1286094 RepID=S3ZVF6_9ACTN|nr:XRE family transcriptional regulator [Streptomyces aurantiacus]EPH42400.1 hypothetical protein STRAU_4540 [Streptomyces aurantiacus JA 4570]